MFIWESLSLTTLVHFVVGANALFPPLNTFSSTDVKVRSEFEIDLDAAITVADEDDENDGKRKRRLDLCISDQDNPECQKDGSYVKNKKI